MDINILLPLTTVASVDTIEAEKRQNIFLYASHFRWNGTMDALWCNILPLRVKFKNFLSNKKINIENGSVT